MYLKESLHEFMNYNGIVGNTYVYTNTDMHAITINEKGQEFEELEDV